MRALRRCREGLRRIGDEGEIACERGADRFPRRQFSRQELRGARAAIGLVEQIRRRHRRQHEVVVDHAVVVDRRIAGRVALFAMAQHGEFADVFLMRHFALRVESLQHGRQPILDRYRLQCRHQQAQRHQSVAAEIGVETPGTGEEFFLIAQEGQRLPAAQIGAGVRVEQAVFAQRSERSFAGQRGNAQAHRFAGRGGGEGPRRLAIAPRGFRFRRRSRSDSRPRHPVAVATR